MPAEAGQAHRVRAVEIARASVLARPPHRSSPPVPAVPVLAGTAANAAQGPGRCAARAISDGASHVAAAVLGVRG